MSYLLIAVVYIKVYLLSRDTHLTKFSQLLALVSWASFFVEGWLLMLRSLATDALSISFLVLFFILAVMSGAVAQDRPNVSKPTITKIDGGVK